MSPVPKHPHQIAIGMGNIAGIKKLEFDMDKYGVELDPDKTKTASETKHCPICGTELEKDSSGKYLMKCPNHGTEPFERKS